MGFRGKFSEVAMVIGTFLLLISVLSLVIDDFSLLLSVFSPVIDGCDF